jgi:hypothetical protein
MKSFQEVFNFAFLIFLLSCLSLQSLQAFSFGKSKISVQVNSGGTDSSIAVSESNAKQIVFEIKNGLRKKAFFVPFAYVRRFIGQSWRWVKGQVFELDENQVCSVNLGAVPTDEDALSVFGNLCVFDSYEEALNATVELTSHEHKIELDVLANLIGKKIAVQSRTYGIMGEQLFYSVIDPHEKPALTPLDFMVANNTAEPILVTSFLYGRDQTIEFFAPWRFSKSSVYEIQPGQRQLIAVEKYDNEYDRINVKGFLGVFEKKDVKEAVNSVYELLSPKQKISLGKVSNLAGKQVVVNREAYGSDSHFAITIRSAV